MRSYENRYCRNTFLKVSFSIRRSYVYIYLEGYELPGIQLWAHMRLQISKPMPVRSDAAFRNWLSTNRDPFKYSLFSTRSARVSDISK